MLTSASWLRDCGCSCSSAAAPRLGCSTGSCGTSGGPWNSNLQGQRFELIFPDVATHLARFEANRSFLFLQSSAEGSFFSRFFLVSILANNDGTLADIGSVEIKRKIYENQIWKKVNTLYERGEYSMSPTAPRTCGVAVSCLGKPGTDSLNPEPGIL